MRKSPGLVSSEMSLRMAVHPDAAKGGSGFITNSLRTSEGCFSQLFTGKINKSDSSEVMRRVTPSTVSD